MRFLSNGPNIPDTLLERRDEGKVVFLCGAGVSKPAGMPGFVSLTQQVIGALRPSAKSEIVRSFRPWIEGGEGPKAPLDQIFQLLHTEFGVEQVNRIVAKILSIKGRKYDHQNHSVVARISSDKSGRPQIVTTNFDRLFEKVGAVKRSRVHTPPSFPEVKHGVGISGITYLHGRLAEVRDDKHDYVLSSGDLGRAYLAGAWATDFVRSLLTEYTVVLLGYQAEDPPIKYLLQGLNSASTSYESEIYAFDQGADNEVDARWRDRGVRPIPFKKFDDLWTSLEQWAFRADNPEGWKRSVVEKSRKGPRALDPYERGMVVHLVRSQKGAQLFAKAEPPITPEWLCVFDETVRKAKPVIDYHNDKSEFSPLEVYGLDDDIVGDGDLSAGIGDILKWRNGDEYPLLIDGLVAEYRRGWRPLSSRIDLMGDWIVSCMGSPIVAWWVGKKICLDDNLVRRLEKGVRDIGMTAELKAHWMALLEAVRDVRNADNHDFAWYECIRRIESENWSNSSLRYLEYATRPRFSIEQYLGVSRARPPHPDFNESESRFGNYLKVTFPSMSGVKLSVPKDKVVQVFRILQLQLQRATEMLQEIANEWFRFPTCYPKREQEGETYVESTEGFFYWFLSVLNEVARTDPECVRASVALWSSIDNRYFAGLWLYVFNVAGLYSPSEVINEISNADFALLMDRSNRREFLFLLEDRWVEFSDSEKVKLARFCLANRSSEADNSDQVYPVEVVRCLAWLKMRGCLFPREVEMDVERAISSQDGLSAAELESVTIETGVMSRTVVVDETPGELLDAPIHSVLEIASRETVQHFWDENNREPFLGLVKSNFKKALLAVIWDAKGGNYKPYYWRALISNWPKQHSKRLFCVFTQNLIKFPQEFVIELDYSIGSWFTELFPGFYMENESASLLVFDHFLACFDSCQGATDQGGSEIAENDSGNVTKVISRQVEKATEGVFLVLQALKLEERNRIPAGLAERLGMLLRVRNEVRGDAVSCIARNLNYLFFIDPQWVRKELLPLFSNEETERHVWMGVFSARSFPLDRVWAELKKHFINLFQKVYCWRYEEQTYRNAHRFIVFGAHASGRGRMTGEEVSDCIRAISEEGRGDVILCLSEQKDEDGWRIVANSFIRRIWPKELKYRTAAATQSWLRLLSRTDKMFPKVYQEVKELLVPSSLSNVGLYRFSRETGEKECLSSRFPLESLDLLSRVVSDDPEKVPYELDQILSEIRAGMPQLEKDVRFKRLTDLVNRAGT